jgi:hypothetical protein
MSSDPHALTFAVEDSFHIRGRGVVLAPAFEVDRFPSGTCLTVSITASSGEPQSCLDASSWNTCGSQVAARNGTGSSCWTRARAPVGWSPEPWLRACAAPDEE